MKDSLKKIVMLLLFVAFVMASYYLAQKYNVQKWFQGDENKITLFVEEGEVYLKEESGDYEKVEESEKKVSDGDWVKTREGLASILLPDNSYISIDENTEIQINYDGDNVNIFQTIGNTWHRVNKMLTGSYSVETNDSIASVRGTRFSVEVSGVWNDSGNFEPIGTAVYVLENSVEVAQYVKDGSTKTKRFSTIVEENKMAEVVPVLIAQANYGGQITDNMLQKHEITEDMKNREWFKRNLEIDKNLPVDENGRYDDRVRDKIQERITENVFTFDPNTLSESQIMCNQAGYDSISNGAQTEYQNGNITEDKYNEILAAVKDVKGVCEDSSLSTDVKDQKIIDIMKKVGADLEFSTFAGDDNNSSVTFSTISGEFNNEIHAKIEYYTGYDGTNGTTLCSRYEGRAVVDILAEFKAIEDKYGVDSEVAEDFKRAVYEIKLACSDGKISTEEAEKMNPPL